MDIDKSLSDVLSKKYEEFEFKKMITNEIRRIFNEEFSILKDSYAKSFTEQQRDSNQTIDAYNNTLNRAFASLSKKVTEEYYLTINVSNETKLTSRTFVFISSLIIAIFYFSLEINFFGFKINPVNPEESANVKEFAKFSIPVLIGFGIYLYYHFNYDNLKLQDKKIKLKNDIRKYTEELKNLENTQAKKEDIDNLKEKIVLLKKIQTNNTIRINAFTFLFPMILGIIALYLSLDKSGWLKIIIDKF